MAQLGKRTLCSRSVVSSNGADLQTCPACGKLMLIRRRRSGPFLGCAGYPVCRKTMPLSIS
ncbi:MAG: topoisomerase DNA-binding C4 zinc finger domain-containing protein [Blastocatellia bacterium]